MLELHAQNNTGILPFKLPPTFKKASQSYKLWQLQSQPQLDFKLLKDFDGQTLTRLYRPTWNTFFLINKLNVSNGERNIQGFGPTNFRIPYSMYSRKYDAFFEARERQNY
jgi:hypothetical protein